MDLEKYSIHIFLEKHQIKTSNGVPFEFYDHPFMWDIFEDMSPRLCILKAPQIGASEMSIVKMFWVSKYLNKDIIYTLPAASDVNDFAGAKINRIIAQNPIFGEWVDSKDSVEQKAIGNNRIHFRGTWTTRAAMMVSSNLNIHDEIDASNQEVITQYETRQQATAGGWKWTFSHPSVVGNGVDKDWQKSDKKEWFITCPHCKDEHFISWPNSIDVKTKSYICQACKEPISDDVRRQGYWKATAQGEISGYHISQLICPWITAEKVIGDFNEKDARYFHNFVLGLPYADPSNQVTLDVIERNLRAKTTRRGRVIIGVDTGIDIRYVIGDMGGIFAYGEVKSYQDLKRIINSFKDSIVIADQGGDLIGIRELQQELIGRVFLCYFQQDKKNMQLIRWGEKDEFGKVLVDRNRIIQFVVDELNADRYPFTGSKTYWYNYYTHWASMYRLSEIDPLGNRVIKWERNGRNDWAIATCYWRVGMDRFSEQESAFLGGAGFMDMLPDAPLATPEGLVFI